jgi:hypothetical protein
VAKQSHTVTRQDITRHSPGRIRGETYDWPAGPPPHQAESKCTTMVSGVLSAMTVGMTTLRAPMLRSCAASLATMGGSSQQDSRVGIRTLRMEQAQYGWTKYGVQDTSRG